MSRWEWIPLIFYLKVYVHYSRSIYRLYAIIASEWRSCEKILKSCPPLHNAAYRNNINVIELLVSELQEADVDNNIDNNVGKSSSLHSRVCTCDTITYRVEGSASAACTRFYFKLSRPKPHPRDKIIAYNFRAYVTAEWSENKKVACPMECREKGH